MDPIVIGKLLDEPYWDEIEFYLKSQVETLNELPKELIGLNLAFCQCAETAILEALIEKFISYHFHINFPSAIKRVWINKNVTNLTVNVPVNYEKLKQVNYGKIREKIIQSILIFSTEYKKEELAKINDLNQLFQIMSRAKKDVLRGV